MTETPIQITIDRTRAEALLLRWREGAADDVIIASVRDLFAGYDGDLHELDASLTAAATNQILDEVLNDLDEPVVIEIRKQSIGSRDLVFALIGIADKITKEARAVGGMDDDTRIDFPSPHTFFCAFTDTRLIRVKVDAVPLVVPDYHEEIE